ncbi:MAG: 4-hydroxy-3-methylbut-2-enyl diphosphate reductase [Bacillota bacterium]
MQVVSLTPRGYCHGVVYAINTVRKLTHNPHIKKPIHVLGMIVHNKKIVEDLDALGVKTLHEKGVSRVELLDRISEGTVVFTAHGVSEEVRKKADEKHLDIIDTTCKDVIKSQNTMKTYLDGGYDVIFIGKKNHPESETAKALGPNIHIVTNEEDIETLDIDNEKIALTNQTTMSMFDIYSLSETLKNKYPSLILIEEICNATKTRQLAVKTQPKDIDHCFVVGDNYSNNSNKLVQVSMQSGINASLIESVEDIDVKTLRHFNKVSVTSGASTPTKVTSEVIRFLKNFDAGDPSTHSLKSAVLSKNLFT